MLRCFVVGALAVQWFCSTANALSLSGVGGESGLSSNYLSWEDQGSASGPSLGFSGGMFVDATDLFSREIGIRPSISYSRRGAGVFTLDYLSMPLLVTWRSSLGKAQKLIVGAGPSAEVLLREGYEEPDPTASYGFYPPPDLFRGFNIGAYAAIGVEWAHYGMSLRYYRDVTSPERQGAWDDYLATGSAYPESVVSFGVLAVLSVTIAGA